MKRFALLLSLFTPIIFATDSFATEISWSDINQETSLLTNLVNLNLRPYKGTIRQGSFRWTCGEKLSDQEVLEWFIYEFDADGNGVLDQEEGRRYQIWWASSAEDNNEQTDNFLLGSASCNNIAGQSYIANGSYVDAGDAIQDDGPLSNFDRNGRYCWCNLLVARFNNYGLLADNDYWLYLGDLGSSCSDFNSDNSCAMACADIFADGTWPSLYNTFLDYTYTDEENIRECLISAGSEQSGASTPARSPLRVAAATHNAGENALVSAAYARGAYNANVANINNAIEYVEDSSVATINSAKVSADNVSLSVNGFTPSGTVSVNSSNATVSGTFNVPTTVALMDEWGATTTTNATLGGIQQANITNGGISGLSATFTGTASGNLSGTGSFSNASVHVDGWKPVNPQE